MKDDFEKYRSEANARDLASRPAASRKTTQSDDERPQSTDAAEAFAMLQAEPVEGYGMLQAGRPPDMPQYAGWTAESPCDPKDMSPTAQLYGMLQADRKRNKD